MAAGVVLVFLVAATDFVRSSEVATDPRAPVSLPVRLPHEGSGEALKYIVSRSGKLYASAVNSVNGLGNNEGENHWQGGEDGGSVTFPRETYGGSDLATSADGYSASIGWPEDKGYAHAKNPIRAYGYLKGWGAPHTFGHHHGWPPVHQHHYGWGQGHGWGSDDWSHVLWDKFSSWFGFAGSTAGSSVLAVFKYVVITIPIIALIIVVVMFLPIPAIITPGICARAGTTTKLWTETGRLAQVILTSDECIERISCQLASATKKLDTYSVLDSIMTYVPNTSTWVDRVTHSIKAAALPSNTTRTTHGGDGCHYYSCDPMAQLKRALQKSST